MAMGDMNAESPPMRTPIVSVHQRSPGPTHSQMETHWEESTPTCRYMNKHSRLLDLYIVPRNIAS